MTRPASDLDGFRLWPGLLDRAAQEALRDEVFARMRAGPLYIPRMPKSGVPMRVRASAVIISVLPGCGLSYGGPGAAEPPDSVNDGTRRKGG